MGSNVRLMIFICAIMIGLFMIYLAAHYGYYHVEHINKYVDINIYRLNKNKTCMNISGVDTKIGIYLNNTVYIVVVRDGVIVYEGNLSKRLIDIGVVGSYVCVDVMAYNATSGRIVFSWSVQRYLSPYGHVGFLGAMFMLTGFLGLLHYYWTRSGAGISGVHDAAGGVARCKTVGFTRHRCFVAGNYPLERVASCISRLGYKRRGIGGDKLFFVGGVAGRIKGIVVWAGDNGFYVDVFFHGLLSSGSADLGRVYDLVSRIISCLSMGGGEKREEKK